MEIEKTDSHIPSASATAKLIPNQNTKGAFPSTITPHPSGSSFDWKRLAVDPKNYLCMRENLDANILTWTGFGSRTGPSSGAVKIDSVSS